MKLCIVTHSIIKGDGQGRVNYEVATEAIRRGHHVTLLATQVAPELQQNNQVSWVFIPVKGWPTELFRNLIFAWRSTNWLHKHRSGLDVVKVNGAITWAKSDVNAAHFVHNSWLKFSSKQTKVRSTKDTLNPRQIGYNFYQWMYTALNARWEKEAFHQTQVLVAVSDKVAKDLLEIGVPPESIRVIVNGVDLQEFSPGVTERKRWSLPEGVTLALFAGDIRIPRKNLDTVLHALVKVPDLHLAVVGITEGSPYPQLATSLGLSDRVHFLGFRRDVPEIMKAVDLFVFPSRYEPFGLVVIEAMATGIPVITARSTGAADLVTKEAGIVLPDSDDTEALAQALLSLASDRTKRNKMGQAARAIAEQHSWTSMAKRYVDLFEELNQ
ncbi:glycosyltransferase family 4 protein [Mastigocladopsis repens]|uniref:glycosyltransferase family 4 protein n=1 Tax=Mastigocladopsis repens TaxID=221287 RepID=UPI000474A384|nr:glycosyltransferase family 4 protein [Mastigocladopsis repens]